LPPEIKLYSDPGLTTPHDGNLEILDAGSEKQLSIFCHNEGTGELLDMKAEMVSDSEHPLIAEIVEAPPSTLKPGETWEAKIKWSLSVEEKEGSRRAHLKISGRYVR